MGNHDCSAMLDLSSGCSLCGVWGVGVLFWGWRSVWGSSDQGSQLPYHVVGQKKWNSAATCLLYFPNIIYCELRRRVLIGARGLQMLQQFLFKIKQDKVSITAYSPKAKSHFLLSPVPCIHHLDCILRALRKVPFFTHAIFAQAGVEDFKNLLWPQQVQIRDSCRCRWDGMAS
jgi:hypothetical protein